MHSKGDGPGMGFSKEDVVMRLKRSVKCEIKVRVVNLAAGGGHRDCRGTGDLNAHS